MSDARFFAKEGENSEISKIRYKELGQSSSYVTPIDIVAGQSADSSLKNFLKLKEIASVSATRTLSINNKVNTLSGGSDEQKKNEIQGIVDGLVTKQFVSTFFDAYMAPAGESDIKYRLGEVVSKAENKIFIGNNKNGKTYTPGNMEIDFNISGEKFNSAVYKYFNNLFPPFNKNNFGSADEDVFKEDSNKWVWNNVGSGFEKEAPNSKKYSSGTTYFDKDTMTTSRNLTFRGLSFKGINDNISLLQKIMEGATGIVSTYMTEWDISLYIQEKIFSKDTIPCLTMNIKSDNPSEYRDSRAYSYGQLNAAISKISEADGAINELAWEPFNYPLSCYWSPYTDVTDSNNTDRILAVASLGLSGNGLKEYGFSKDSFKDLNFDEQIKFFDFQGAAYAGWNSFSGLKNYQMIYTSSEDELSRLDMLHLQSDSKEFAFTPNAGLDCILSPIEDYKLNNVTDYGKKPEFWEENAVFEELDSIGYRYYTSFCCRDADGKFPKVAFGKKFWTDRETNKYVIKEEYVADTNGAPITLSTLKADTALQLYNFCKKSGKNLKNGFLNFFENNFKISGNNQYIGAWNDSLTEAYKSLHTSEKEGTFGSLFKSFADSAVKYSELFKTDETWGGIALSHFAMPKMRVFSKNVSPTVPETSKVSTLNSSVNISSAFIDEGTDTKNAPRNGVCQLSPGLYGGPHGAFAHPNSIKGYFEGQNEALRNTPRISHIGVLNSKGEFEYKQNIQDIYNQGTNSFYGNGVNTRSPACALNMLKYGFFEPTNYEMKIRGMFTDSFPYTAKTKTVSASEFNNLKAKYPGIKGEKKNYGKEYKITYYEPSKKTAGNLNSTITYAKSTVYSLDEFSSDNPTKTGTGSFSTSVNPVNKAECLSYKGAPNYPGGAFEWEHYIRYATDDTYFVRSTEKKKGTMHTNASGYNSGKTVDGYELMRVQRRHEMPGTYEDDRFQTYNEPLIMSDFKNTWQISKVFTQDIKEKNKLSAFFGNLFKPIKKKSTTRNGGFKLSDEKTTHYILRFKGNYEDTSGIIEEAEDSNGNKFKRCKAWDEKLYMTDTERAFIKIVFGDISNINQWKHPLFFVSKDPSNPSLDSTVEVVQIPIKLSTYDYLMEDASKGSCGKKKVTQQKLTGTYIEADIENIYDTEWLSQNSPLKFSGLGANLTPYKIKSDSFSDLSKNVDEILPEKENEIEEIFDLKDLTESDGDLAEEKAPCKVSWMAGLTDIKKDDDDEDDSMSIFKKQAWCSGIGYTTYLPGLNPDVSSISTDAIKKIVSLNELAPFTMDATYSDTYAYFKEALAKSKKYTIEGPVTKKGFKNNQYIEYALKSVKIEPKRSLKANEISMPIYKFKNKLYLEEDGKIYFLESIISALNSSLSEFSNLDTLNGLPSGTTLKSYLDMLNGFLNKGESDQEGDNLFALLKEKCASLVLEKAENYVFNESDTIDTDLKFITQTDASDFKTSKPELETDSSREVILTYAKTPQTAYVDEIKEKTVTNKFTAYGSDKESNLILYEYSYNLNFKNEPATIYVLDIKENYFKYDTGEYSDEENGIAENRKHSFFAYYYDANCTQKAFKTANTKEELSSRKAFAGSEVETYSKQTAEIRKNLAKSAFYIKYSDIFIDDWTKTREKTKREENSGTYKFNTSEKAEWSYEYVPYALWAPKDTAGIVAGTTNLSKAEFTLPELGIHKTLSKIFSQMFLNSPFIKRHNESPESYTLVDNIVPFKVLYKSIVFQKYWLSTAKKFFVDLIDFDAAKALIESGVSADLLAHTIPEAVGKEKLSNEGRENIKFRYWIESAWNIFSSSKEDFEKYFQNAENELEKILGDKYGQKAIKESLSDITPEEQEGMFKWLKQAYDFLSNESYNMCGKYMLSYLNVLYELRKYFINKRCNKVSGTLWALRALESAIPLVKDTAQVDSSGIEKLNDEVSGKMNSYDVISKESTVGTKAIVEAAISKNGLNENRISHIFTKLDYVDFNNKSLQNFLTKINQPDFELSSLTGNEDIFVFLPYNAKFILMPKHDTYTLTSGRYYEEKAKSQTNKAVKESFREINANGQYTSNLKEYKWEIEWKHTDFKTLGDILKGERYANQAEMIQATLLDNFKDFINNSEELLNYKVLYYENESDNQIENIKNQKETKTPIIVFDIVDGINLSNISGVTKAMSDGSSDATSFYCSTGSKSDYWRIKVPENGDLPLYSDFEDNCKIEALDNVSQSVNFNEKITTVLGAFAYSAYPIDEKQSNNVAGDIMNSFGISQLGEQ